MVVNATSRESRYQAREDLRNTLFFGPIINPNGSVYQYLPDLPYRYPKDVSYRCPKDAPYRRLRDVQIASLLLLLRKTSKQAPTMF